MSEQKTTQLDAMTIKGNNLTNETTKEVGDLVQHVTGGPVMLVTFVSSSGSRVTVAWMDGNDHFMEDFYPMELVPAQLPKKMQYLDNRLGHILRSFINKNEISCPESLFQVDKNIEKGQDVLEELCGIVGYWHDPNGDTPWVDVE